MISDPREAGFSAKVRLSHPWGQAVPGGIGWGDHRETALGYMCHVRDSSSRCDTRAQNRMSVLSWEAPQFLWRNARGEPPRSQ